MKKVITIFLIFFVIKSLAHRIYFDNYYAYEVTGISMMPNIKDGDDLFVFQKLLQKKQT